MEFDNQEQDDLSLSDPQIILTIPDHLCKDFLGIMALDILHDSKGRGYLVGHKLCQLTDLIAEAIISNTSHLQREITVIQNYIFKNVLNYLLELWSENIQALGLYSRPDTTINIEQLRATVTLPIRRVADRINEDTFITLGKDKLGIEAQNYYDQLAKLTTTNVDAITFSSPHGIRTPLQFFDQAKEVVNVIRHNTSQKSKVVLDMKSAAGLLRTVTDPLGYITGLPTFADPGYNMPGMSAIRQSAEKPFLQAPAKGTYSGPKEFRYSILLDTELQEEPMVLLDIAYFYGVAKDCLDRNNLIINILGQTFLNTLPRSFMMGEALGNYLKPSPLEETDTVGNILETVGKLIWDVYDKHDQRDYVQTINNVYLNLNTGGKMSLNTLVLLTQDLPYNTNIISSSIFNWCNEENYNFRASYILSTLRNIHFYEISNILPVGDHTCILPENMIMDVLPNLMFEYQDSSSNRILAFCYHQYSLLTQYISKPGIVEIPYQANLDNLLLSQWLPSRKGKLTTQIEKNVIALRKRHAEILLNSKEELTIYIQDVISSCQRNLTVLFDIDDTNRDDPRILEVLQSLPLFQPSISLKTMLTEYLRFYYPDIHNRTMYKDHTGLLVAVLLGLVLDKKPLVKLPLNLYTEMTAAIKPTTNNYQNTLNALRMVLGKFSGDFGQIMWSICHGHLFASEDNNASAMALMLHRLPQEYIHTNIKSRNSRWGNIHGLGDGSRVDIMIDKC